MQPYEAAFMGVITFAVLGVMAAANGRIGWATFCAMAAFLFWLAYMNLATVA